MTSTLSLPITLLPHAVSTPNFATDGAAGCDLHAALKEGEPTILKPGARALIPTGICMAIPTGKAGLVCSRSGLALKQGLCVLNAPGIIDSDYRGEVGVVLINHGENSATLMRGDRIAQLIFVDIPNISLQVCKSLPNETKRGVKGFGSTGH